VIEVGLKARLARPYHVRAALRRRAEAERAVYHDTYYDTRAGTLEQAGLELRLRTIEAAGTTRHLLTFKEGAKPEHETTLSSPAAIDHMVRALGYHPVIQLTKDCENHRFTDDGREFTATVVTVPEIDGTYLELETLAAARDVDDALSAVRQLLSRLGIGDGELTTELYADAARAARA
jgi:adenylate cyclase class 2